MCELNNSSNVTNIKLQNASPRLDKICTAQRSYLSNNGPLKRTSQIISTLLVSLDLDDLLNMLEVLSESVELDFELLAFGVGANNRRKEKEAALLRNI